MEQGWRDVHASLMPYMRDMLQPQLPGDLRARIEENVQLDEAERAPQRRNPDVYIVETPKGHSTQPADAGIAVLDEPIILEPENDPLIERHIEITDSKGRKVITAIEVLSPWNKLEGSGKERYLRKREQYIASGANLVEVDLVRAGRWWNMVDAYYIAPENRTTYRVTVKRTGQWKLELYRAPLSQRLPTVGIPLRPHEADIKLALQPLIEQVYRNGRYDLTDYAQPCDPPLEGAEAEYAAERIRGAGLG